MINPLITQGINVAYHQIRRTFGILCVLLVCAGLYYAVYRTFIKPRATESYQQKAEQITNIEYNYNECDKKFFIGLKLWGFRLGLSK